MGKEVKMASEKTCRDCGLAIDSGQYCEFCKERHAAEAARGIRKADKVRRRVPVKAGIRGQDFGWGGEGVALEERDFFGDGYNVAVSADPFDRVARASEAEDVAAGNPDAEDVPDGEDAD